MESERRSGEVREQTMERSHQNRRGRGNHSSFSPSSQSTWTRNTKVSNFNESSSATNYATNNRSNAHDVPQWKPSRGNTSSSTTQKEKIKTDEDKEEDSSDFPRLIGTCPSMCPESERSQRERLQDLAVFERLHGNPRKTSPALAVKKIFFVLLMVLWTRSIRQDLSMQNIVDDKSIYMYEKMVKFHVISHLKLQRCGSSPNISSVHYLNMEQLTKALTSLYNLYDANRDSSTVYRNEAEFRSLYVLLHLDSNSQPMGESLSLWFRCVPHPIIRSKEMCFARSVLRFYQMGNYVRFFSTISAEASYLQYCILELYMSKVRALSLSYINNAGYKLHPYPLVHLSKLLKMKESDLEVLCNACGLETCADEMENKLLPTKQTTFCCPKEGFQSYNFIGIGTVREVTS
ncbi:GERMINAL-CENTER ASSOCIATED NUCLEAR PROTEIN [Salix koriyanagi]|uniref:GERMINAL-CENTER ASSOCIATED NUCLEAR PROTEIN n=1 Tax=Salix koriyanagi TaxID=2511006 RepID=A0A9Q0T6E7_9ROSI|nr:GERMINAL-CENTER ASSOCIATED NUCLEAR PROTEIN [Salix koriyanagi]